MHRIVIFITFKKLWNKVLELGFNYSIEKPTKQYVQYLIIDTQNAVTHLDTKYLLLQYIRKYHIWATRNVTNILYKRKFHKRRQIHRNQTKNN